MILPVDRTKILINSWWEVYRSAGHLIYSYHRITPMIPLNQNSMNLLHEEELERLDAFRTRFCNVQDGLHNKAFRALLAVEYEETTTMLDVIHKMEKRRIIASENIWKVLREIRNIFAHDYPDNDDERAQVLNAAYNHSPLLLEIVNQLTSYLAANFPEVTVFTGKKELWIDSWLD